MTQEQYIRSMQYNVFAKNLDAIEVNESRLVINTLNAYSYVVAENNAFFKQALQNSDILVADGFPIVLAAKILAQKKIFKIAGADLFYHFMSLMNTSKGKVFFLGSSDATLEKIIANAKNDFPEVNTFSFSPPFKKMFTHAESQIMIDHINRIQPDILFVGMTAPKQECWVEENKSFLQAKVICSIGAVFDFYAGTVKRAPVWMINSKSEWLYRLIKEPKRMWKRYLIYSPKFFFYLFLHILKIRK